MEVFSPNSALERAMQANDIRLARRALIAGAVPDLEMVWQVEDGKSPHSRLSFTPLEWCARMSLLKDIKPFRRARWHALIARLLAAGADPTHSTKGLGEGSQADTVSLALLFRSQPLLDLMTKFGVCLPADRVSFYLAKARAEKQPWPEGEAWVLQQVAKSQCDRLESGTARAYGRSTAVSRL